MPQVEWTGEHVALVDLSDDLPGGGYSRRARPISKVIVHHSAGNPLEGESAPRRIAAFHTAPPPRGRGWPGCGYTFVVPAAPVSVDGRLHVYRCNSDDRHTYHTGPRWNAIGVGVCVAGRYFSRHVFADESTPSPGADAWVALEELVLAYLLPRYGLSVADLRGHFDAGKLTCPGDALEAWVRRTRGEAGVLPPGVRRRTVVHSTVLAQQRALIALGYDPGPEDGLWGEQTRAAVEAFQRDRGLRVDGQWGPQVDSQIPVRT